MLAKHPSSAHERIGRYEVLRKIATGGMAELFLAKMVGMEGFEKVVAIKRILAHLAYDEEFINMFRDEARIVAKLSHPNIVQIYDLGKSDDTYFIAMEYIPGRNLSSIAKKAKALERKLPPAYIARCIGQACEGLYYAHTRKDIDGRPLKIVHRDVSPQNIIASFSGTVKLVDFGIAKAATKIAHTRAGVLKGKYAYMSPEQIRGEETDARSDLFAVGIVLYELLCGRRPFEKENSIQTLKAIVQDPHVDCRALNDEIPDELAEIIDLALSKDPALRFQNAQEVQIALEDFVNGGKERVNNITISNWVTDLFEEELSRERGGTVVFQGVGEVILPDSEAREPADDLAVDVDVDDDDDDLDGASSDDVSEELVPLSRGRGGGSIDARPPIPAPSNAMVQNQEATGHSRREMIEEGVINRDEDDGGWDDATVHGLDAVSQSTTDPPYNDDQTEFAPPHVPPEDVTGAVNDSGDLDRVASESLTLSPDDIQMARRPQVRTPSDALALEVGESLLGPLEDDGGAEAFLTDDPWDEATVGYPEGASDVVPVAQASVNVESSPPSRASIPPAVTAAIDEPPSLESLSNVFAVDDDDGDGWGELSDDFEGDATIAGEASLWDDETASRDAFVDGTGEISAPIQSVVIAEDSDNVELDLLDADIPDDEELNADSTIALPSVSEDMIRRAREDASIDFEGEETISADQARFRLTDHTSEMEESSLPEVSSRSDSNAWANDATIAGGSTLDDILRREREDSLDEMPDIGQDSSTTVRAMDEEPELPVPHVDRSNDLDARTVAGVTSDFMQAGVDIPENGGYDSLEESDDLSFEDPPTQPPNSKRAGIEALGAIQLNRVKIEPPSVHEERTQGRNERTHGSNERTSSGVPASRLMPAGPPEPSLPELDGVDFEFAIEDTGDDVPPVQPRPLDEGDEPPNFSMPSIAGEEYSRLVAPGVPKPLVPPSSSRIGSTNVPPSNLSLSQVLSAPPDRSPASSQRAMPRNVSLPGRSASMIGRQIREVVRPGEEDSATAPPATPSALHFTPQSLAPMSNDTVEPMGPPMSLPPAMAPAEGASTRRWLIIGLVALAVLLLSGVAVVSIPLLFPGEPRLEVATTPPGATVFVDGVKQDGETPLTIRGLEAGVSYLLRVERAGHQPTSRKVLLQPSRPSAVWNVALEVAPK